MKLITAILRPEKLDELIETLIDSRVHGLTVSEVRGFGRQFGQLAHGADIDLGLPSARKGALLPKVRLDLVVPDDGADALVETLAKHARTDTIGDGKIWVSMWTASCGSGPASGIVPRYNRGSLGFIAHDQHRAVRVMHAMLAHRAEQGLGEAAVTAAADDEQVRVGRGV